MSPVALVDESVFHCFRRQNRDVDEGNTVVGEHPPHLLKRALIVHNVLENVADHQTSNRPAVKWQAFDIRLDVDTGHGKVRGDHFHIRAVEHGAQTLFGGDPKDPANQPVRSYGERKQALSLHCAAAWATCVPLHPTGTNERSELQPLPFADHTPHSTPDARELNRLQQAAENAGENVAELVPPTTS